MPQSRSTASGYRLWIGLTPLVAAAQARRTSRNAREHSPTRPRSPAAAIRADRRGSPRCHPPKRGRSRAQGRRGSGWRPRSITASRMSRAWFKILGRTGSSFSSRRRCEQLELDVVNERSALQRIELIDSLGHFARREAVHGLEEELVRTAARSSEARSANSCVRQVACFAMIARTVSDCAKKPVRRRPAKAPPLIPRSEGSGEIWIGGQQITRRAGAIFRGRGKPIEGWRDRTRHHRWPQPDRGGAGHPIREVGRRLRPPGKFGKVGQPALGGAHRFQAHRRTERAVVLGRDRGGDRRKNSRRRRRRRRVPGRAARSRGGLDWSPSSASSCWRAASSRIGSSMILRGKSFSASPGTKTASKLSPRAASIGPTKTWPYRWRGRRDCDLEQEIGKHQQDLV